MIDVLMNSGALVLLATLTAVVVGFPLGCLYAAQQIYRDSAAWGVARSVAEFIILGLEMIPAVAALLLACWHAGTLQSESSKIILFAVTGGVVWSGIIARTVSNRLSFEFDREYTRQLCLWGVKPFLTVALKMVIQRHWKEIAAAATTVVLYAVVTDTSLGYLLYETNMLDGAGVSYYQNSLGKQFTGSGLSEQARLIALAGLMGVLIGLVLLVNWLEKGSQRADDRLLRTMSLTDGGVLDVQDLDVLVGQQFGGGFQLESTPDVPIQLREGEILWLRGASGSGKSLLFKSLVRLLPPDSHSSGQVQFSRAQKEVSNVEVIFQEPSLYLYPYLRIDALTTLATDREYSEVASATVQARYPDLHTQYVDTCSAGQKRLIYADMVFWRLTQAANSEDAPQRLVLCDEPDASLDDENRVQLVRRLAHLQSSGRFGVAYVSHNPAVVKELADAAGRGRVRVMTCEPSEAESGGGAVSKIIAESPRVLDSLPPSTTNDIPPGARQPSTEDPSFSVLNLRVYFPGEEEIEPAYRFRKLTPLSFARGQVYVLFGPNGRGKSTFFKGLSGLYPSTADSLVVHGDELKTDQPDWLSRSQYFGHVFDDTEKSLPIAEKIGDFVKPIYERWKDHGADMPGFEKLVIGMLAGHGIDTLDALYERYPMSLSGGMRQILVYGIGRYLVRTPVMLLDEPFSRVHGHWEEQLIEDLFGDRERTYLLITHRGDKLVNRGACAIHLDDLEPEERRRDDD